MATVQLGTTKSAGKLTNYAEKKAIIKDGVNVDADYAKSQMKMTREMYGKDDGIQAHHVIQSFQPGEVTESHGALGFRDRKSTRLNSSHVAISYAVFCLKKNMTLLCNMELLHTCGER